MKQRRTWRAAAIAVGVVLATATPLWARGGGPDVVYSDCQSITNWGEVGNIHGYSLGSYTCNIGDEDLLWGDTPYLAMNAYRLHDGRLIQIGMSFVKEACCALAGGGCGETCNGHGGSVLGAGCRDIYSSSWNGGHTRLGPRSALNGYTGAYAGALGDSGNAIYKRLQVAEADMSEVGAMYIVEGVYVAPDDASAGNAHNNASYKRVSNSGAPNFELAPIEPIALGDPAIQAWRDHGLGVGLPDPTVTIVTADIPNEGRFHIATKVTLLKNGNYLYDYAVFNLNSHRSAGGFSVLLPSSATVFDTGFHDVDYHSGEPYDNTDWSVAEGVASITWSSPQTFDENPDSNALRWGTMYNFWFETDAAPNGEAGTDPNVRIRLFRPGRPDDIAKVLAGPMIPCPGDLDGDDDVDQSDLGVLLAAYGQDAGGDLDGDGETDQSDLGILLANFGCMEK